MESAFSDFRVALLASLFGREQVREPAGMVFIIDFSEWGQMAYFLACIRTFLGGILLLIDTYCGEMVMLSGVGTSIDPTIFTLL